MEALEVDFEFPRGDTPPISFRITDLDLQELDLENAEIYFTMKKNANVTNFILQKKYSTGEITVDGDQGSFIMEHEDTANLKYGNYWYDIQIMLPREGTTKPYVKTLAVGHITLTNESTFISNE